MTLDARKDDPDAPAEELPLQEFVAEVHNRILGKLYDLAQNETMLSMALIPLMAHLKKMPKAMLTDFDYEEKRRKGQL